MVKLLDLENLAVSIQTDTVQDSGFEPVSVGQFAGPLSFIKEK
jgi:hypothetical protein